MDEAITKMLDAMAEVSNHDSPWLEKKKAIEAKLKEYEAWETAWEEIMSWWLPDEENH